MKRVLVGLLVAGLAGRLGLVEPVEDPLEAVIGNTRAGVGHGPDDLPGPGLGGHHDQALPWRWSTKGR